MKQLLILGPFPPPAHRTSLVTCAFAKQAKSYCSEITEIDLSGSGFAAGLSRLSRMPKCALALRQLLVIRASHSTLLYLALSANWGQLYDQLRQKRNCCFSEFYPDLPLGASLGEAQNQDLTDLTYHDAIFDLAISEHVLEHVNDPHKAFAELYRILKPGGALIFSIPFEGGESSQTRITPDGIAVSPKKFHKNPLSSKGSLVFSDFSKNDLVSKYLTPAGFAAEILTANSPESSIRNSLVIYAVRPPV